MTNHINLDKITTKPASDEFKAGWDRIFGNPAKPGPEQKRIYCGATAPPQRKEWVGLTDEEIIEVWSDQYKTGLQLARAIEAKLKEKNA